MGYLEADRAWLDEKPLSGVSSTLGSREEEGRKFHLLPPPGGEGGGSGETQGLPSLCS